MFPLMMRFAIANAITPMLRLTNTRPMLSLSLSSSHYYNIIQHRIIHSLREQQKYFSTASTERIHNRKASTSPRNANGSRPYWLFNIRSTIYYRYYQRYKLWAMILGLLTIGSIVKVVYFKFSRQMIVSDANAKHIKNMAHLHEANAYAQWSEQDRLSKLPSITPEQRQQIQQYLSIIEQHGFSKSIAAQQGQQEKGDGNSNDLANAKCPILSNTSSNKTATTK